MNPYKKFDKAWQKLQRFPTFMAPNTTNREFARLVKEAYEALNEVIEKEQTFRLNSFFKRKKTYYRTIASQSDTALVAHRGWANRIIDAADVVINEKDPLDRARALDSLLYAKDYLERNLMNLSKPQKDSTFDRAYVSARGLLNKAGQKLKKLKSVKIKPFVKPEEPDSFKSLEQKIQEDLATTMVTLFQEKDLKTGPLPLVPEQQSFNGQKTPPPKWTCPEGNEICYEGWVYGARWGSEDYPCQKCNAEEYEKWQKENHPEELACQPTTTNVPSVTSSSDES